jgi:hypothetical protein
MQSVAGDESDTTLCSCRVPVLHHSGLVKVGHQALALEGGHKAMMHSLTARCRLATKGAAKQQVGPSSLPLWSLSSGHVDWHAACCCIGSRRAALGSKMHRDFSGGA